MYHGSAPDSTIDEVQTHFNFSLVTVTSKIILFFPYPLKLSIGFFESLICLSIVVFTFTFGLPWEELI